MTTTRLYIILAIIIMAGISSSSVAVFTSTQEAIAQAQNQSLNTYRNDEYRFTFQYPGNWFEGTAGVATSFEKQVIILEAPERRLSPDGEREMAETVFSVYATNVSSYLDPDDLQVKSNTAEDYARDETSFMLVPSSYGMSFEFGKNGTTSLAGKNDSWRIDHITSLDGEQRTFSITIFAVRDDVAFRLDFDTNPMKVPEMLPIAEKIIQSFRFI
jgi:hypothetical protein